MALRCPSVTPFVDLSLKLAEFAILNEIHDEREAWAVAGLELQL
jgi:hypothetical protein